MKEQTLEDSELEELASAPIISAAADGAGRFQANVSTSAGPGVETISFESLLAQRRPLWKTQYEERSDDPNQGSEN